MTEAQFTSIFSPYTKMVVTHLWFYLFSWINEMHFEGVGESEKNVCHIEAKSKCIIKENEMLQILYITLRTSNTIEPSRLTGQWVKCHTLPYAIAANGHAPTMNYDEMVQNWIWIPLNQIGTCHAVSCTEQSQLPSIRFIRNSIRQLAQLSILRGIYLTVGYR